MAILNLDKINRVYMKSVIDICNYAYKNPDIKKLVVFGNALDLDNTVDINDEMNVAIYLNDPTPEKIESISRYINDNIDDVWGCVIEDDMYKNSIMLKKDISKGVTIYGG